MVIVVVAAVVGVLALLGGLVVLLNANNRLFASPSTSASIEPSRTAGAEPSETPTETPSETPTETSDETPTAAPSEEENEALFTATIRQRNDLKNENMADLLRIGRAMCKALDEGHGLIEVATSSADDLGAEKSGYVAGAAIVSLCPRHRSKIPS
ncbi:DUF732 domain-containing protein [Streptosporangium sp. NPDC051023]|uniref:DUF732 domain-containing protein n=1 Tax=Streptosporangium sp. NPDC051023 TaxID=3155410 RepID=UPI00344FF68C